MRLDKVKTELSNYFSKMDTLHEAYQRERKTVMNDFSEQKQTELLAKLRTDLDNAELTAKRETLDAVRPVFEEVQKEIEAIAMVAPDADLMNLVNVSALGAENMTAEDAETVWKSVLKNYAAVISLEAIYRKNGVKDAKGESFACLRMTTVSNVLGEAQTMTENAVMGYQAMNYNAALLVTDKGNPLDLFDTNFYTPFINRTA